jgi:molecular chaperone GrpE (heat shock protein)
MLEEHRQDVNKAPPALEPQGPMALVAQGLNQWIERQRDRALQDLAKQALPLFSELGQVQVKQQQALHELEAMRKQFEALLATHKLLENASVENQILGDGHYEEHVILPMVRSLFPILDLVYDAKVSWKEAGEPVGEQFTAFADAIWTQLRQFLLQYEVEIVGHPPHARFDARFMRPVKVHGTNNRSLDGLVARCLQVGFRRGEDRLLRPETVSLYGYRPTQIGTVTSDERTEDEHPRN